MNPLAVDKHVLSGRRTEISLMLYNVHKCKCCGRVQPSHIDSTFVDKDKSPPFKREHLINKHYRVWHCNCWGFCKGSQFFSNVKDTHINEYNCNYNGHHPRDFLHLQEPNAWMCNKCYNNKISSSQVQTGCKYYICISIS